MFEVLHVSPVMPVDEHHIEYALDIAGYPGTLETSWVPRPLEHSLMRMVPALRRSLRREPVRLHRRSLVRHVVPDITRSYDLTTGIMPSVLAAHDAFFRRVDRAAAGRIDSRTSAVVGREFGCLHSFRNAAKVDARRIYHLPTSHHQALKRILEQEAAAFPGVCRSTFDKGEFESGRLDDKLEEIALADRIVCPSAFVRQTLLDAGVADARIAVNPFGCSPSWIEETRLPEGGIFLFVGNISARKGAHRLLAAWKKLQAWKTHRLLLVGDMHLNKSFLNDYQGMYEHRPRMPREDLRDLYLSADALVLPALAEGFALVILEALSCGTPVLASRNSGSEGFLTHGEDALLFDAQDDDALCSALERALSRPDELRWLGERGRDTARSRPWKFFEQKFVEAIRPLLSPV